MGRRSGRIGAMFRFTTKRLLVSTALIAIGVACLLNTYGHIFWTHARSMEYHPNLPLLAWMSSGLWIGGGMGFLWRHAFRGMCIGAMASLVYWSAMTHLFN